MTDPRAEREALTDRLHGAAARLKAAAGDSPDPSQDMSEVLERLEEAGAAVRDARARLAELRERLGDV